MVPGRQMFAAAFAASSKKSRLSRVALVTGLVLLAPASVASDRAHAAVNRASNGRSFRPSGDVRLRSRGDTAIWRRVGPGDTLAGVPRDRHGARGQATLTHGDDVIHIAPNSRMELRPPTGNSVVTQVVQTLGTLFFGVETRPDRRFRVETPYLVTLVKGTTFSITVTAGRRGCRGRRGNGVRRRVGRARCPRSRGRGRCPSRGRESHGGRRRPGVFERVCAAAGCRAGGRGARRCARRRSRPPRQNQGQRAIARRAGYPRHKPECDKDQAEERSSQGALHQHDQRPRRRRFRR